MTVRLHAFGRPRGRLPVLVLIRSRTLSLRAFVFVLEMQCKMQDQLAIPIAASLEQIEPRFQRFDSLDHGVHFEANARPFTDRTNLRSFPSPGEVKPHRMT
jgi:hypothetical protein